MARIGRPVEFRHRGHCVAGRPVSDIARDLETSSQSIDRWQQQDRIDVGLEPRDSSAEAAEVAWAKRRIVQLETDLAFANQAVALLA